ncbi:DUF1345 domain-containing protein [Humitalea sp. 24SJ18S-53]|uniref:DUF1345 domain-containing protein n=1 Tax=Humitalea sp. 24SJ18S-53 TaxID=3422307 RepID=UPI003D66AD31
MALRRPVLVWAVAGGVAAGAAGIAAGMRVVPAIMVGWCLLVTIYTTLMLRHLWAADAETMRRRAKVLVEGRWTVFTLSLLAAIAALGGVGWEAAFAPRPLPWYSPVMTAMTVTMSWLFVQVLFAHDYAHEYWRAEGGIVFPGGDGTPEFSEFLYFSFTVGMTAQVSDVTTDSPAMRKLVLLHGIIAFAFNVVILAVSVNIAAGLVG